jgi:hypothetical protein
MFWIYPNNTQNGMGRARVRHYNFFIITCLPNQTIIQTHIIIWKIKKRISVG